MADIIELLPDAVANQIAAGEVIQRPASVVKELVENAIDSGANKVQVVIKDAGKTLIQVIDNGSGMSGTDARMAFERHATSKIKSAMDLFAIRTMGFRGEALASIAAIAHVELKTRQHDFELGTELIISGSEVQSQESIQCSAGSNFLVKNLFYNVPARRKFLKSNSTELKYIIQEFQRVALSYPDVSLSLNHNATEVYQLSATNGKLRIEQLFRKNIGQHLFSIETETSIVSITGFAGKPESAKKNAGEQYFFVNQRYMKHPYFHKAVMMAYERLLPKGLWPSYFIYFEIDPDAIDINIHPTKTEIKFEDENNIWRILNLSVKEGLGKFNVAPSIDFDQTNHVQIPAPDPNQEIKMPEIQINPEYNPFETSKPKSGGSGYSASHKRESVANWEQLYNGFEQQEAKQEELLFSSDLAKSSADDENIQEGRSYVFQLKNRFILSSVKSGLMVIDQRRAHVRILYERFLKQLEKNVGLSQKLLFPDQVKLDPADAVIFREILPALMQLGFEISESGQNIFLVEALPAEVADANIGRLIEGVLEHYRNSELDPSLDAHQKIANSMANAAAIPQQKTLGEDEMNQLISDLFACSTPHYTPGGKNVLTIINMEDLENLF